MIAETTRDKALTAAANGKQAFVICQKGKYPETVNLTRLFDMVLKETGNIFFADIDIEPKNSGNETGEKPVKYENEEHKSINKGYHGGRPSELDDGKIMALRNAGWSCARIADEMGVEVSTIKYHLKKLKKAV